MIEMTSWERVSAALLGEHLDRVPVADLCSLSAAHTMGCRLRDVRFDAPRSVKVALDFNRMIRSDIIVAPIIEPMSMYMDLGLKVGLSDNGRGTVTSVFFSTPEDIESKELYSPLDPASSKYLRSGIIDHLALLRERKSPGIFTTGWSWGPLTVAGVLRGVEALLMDMIAEPGLAREVITRSTDLIRDIIRLELDPGNDGMFMFEPMASPAVIPAASFAEFAADATRNLFSTVRAYEVPGVLHICGDTASLLDQLPGLGVDCFSIDHSMSISSVRDAIGDRMTIMGNVDPVVDLGRGTPTSVMAASRTCLERASEGGRFILAPGCEVPMEAPIYNVKAMVEASRRFSLH